MAQARTFLVSFNPATKTECGYSVALSLMSGGETHKVVAAGMPALDAEVRRLAREVFKQSASAYVRMPRGERAPPGFNAATNKLNFIEYVAPTE